MDSSLRLFITQFSGVVLATLVPVILIAFMSVPVTLGGHNHDMYSENTPVAQHMT